MTTGPERCCITEEGIAVIEAGLTLRQAHELKRGCSARDLCAECRSAIREAGGKP